MPMEHVYEDVQGDSYGTPTNKYLPLPGRPGSDLGARSTPARIKCNANARVELSIFKQRRYILPSRQYYKLHPCCDYLTVSVQIGFDYFPYCGPENWLLTIDTKRLLEESLVPTSRVIRDAFILQRNP